MVGMKGKAIFEWLFGGILLLTLLLLFLFTKGKLEAVAAMANMEDSKLVLYEGPKSLKDATAADIDYAKETERDFKLMHSTDTSITVNGYDSFVYETNVNLNRSWSSDYLPTQSRTPITYFDFEGTAKIVVKVPNIDLETVKISPLGDQIKPKLDQKEHTVTFTISKPDTYTLVFNHSPYRAVHIFANPIEVNPPKDGDQGVIYIGPGEWNIDNILLEDGQTLYLAGGAVVHGIIQANHAKDVKVKGRGIIDGSTFEGWHGKSALVPLKFDYCDGVEIRDIIALNPNAWVCSANSSSNAIIDGLKIISSRPNGDGITLQSCTDFQVQNCFVRSWDDSLVVKNYSEVNSKHIVFSQIQVWTDLAQSMEIGFETNKGSTTDAKISDITFEDITVLNNFHKPVLSIHNADDAIVSDISYRNIVVENAQMGSGDGKDMPYLIDLWVTKNPNWTTTPERGQIRNITIDGVKVLEGKFNGSRIQGFDETHTIENVTIKNLEILGEKINTLEQGKFEIDAATTKSLVLE